MRPAPNSLVLIPPLPTLSPKMNPRSIGTPMTAGILPLAGFDRLFRRHDVRGLIDFPFPCRTVSTQVLLYVER